MGVSSSSVQVIEPTRLVQTVSESKWLRYSVSFVFQIGAADSRVPTAADIETAIAHCRSEYSWSDYIYSLMSDAAERDIKIAQLSVKLRPTKNPAKWRGRVSWISVRLPEDAVWNGIEWYIGDRMSNYEIQDESGAWFGSIWPKYLTTQVPLRRQKVA